MRTMKLRMRLAAGALAFVVDTAAPRARASNDDGILIGTEAALTGGAVTAIVSDGSAAWYNPAGLAQIRRPTLNLNASTYGFSLSTADSLFTLNDGTQSGARYVDWQLVPSALSYATQLSERLVGAFGIFIPSTTDADLRANVTQKDGTRWALGIDETSYEYAYVFSVAMRQSESFRWGVALHGVYISNEEMTQVGTGIAGMANAPFSVISYHRTSDDYGLRIGAGLQWTPVSNVSLGLSVQTPTLTGFRLVNADTVYGSYAPDQSGASYDSNHEGGLQAVWELSTPLRIRVGVAYRVAGYQLLVDGGISSPIESLERSLDRKLSGNVRLGVLVAVSEAFSYGFGAFTDLSGERGPTTNFLGVAGGIRFAQNHRLASGDRPLTFFTSLGGRYAYGWGQVEGVSFQLADAVTPSTAVDAQSHEFAANLGGGFSY